MTKSESEVAEPDAIKDSPAAANNGSGRHDYRLRAFFLYAQSPLHEICLLRPDLLRLAGGRPFAFKRVE